MCLQGKIGTDTITNNTQLPAIRVCDSTAWTLVFFGYGIVFQVDDNDLAFSFSSDSYR